MFFYAIRGAITVDMNTPQQILEASKILLERIVGDNEILKEDIVSIIFTATKDLDTQYPAVAVRQLGMVDVPLFCCQEMYVGGSLERCIRVLIHIQSSDFKKIHHVYMREAICLRPDLILDFHSEVINIAVDGPAGAGKSTIAKVISEKLNIMYLDTGAMYRAIAYKMLGEEIGLKNISEVVSLLESTDIQIKHEGTEQRIIVNNEDVTPFIRTSEISEAASRVATIPEVRLKLVEIQRQIAKNSSLVMDGRDIGTYVLPNAPLKFYITASLDERANRRWEEYKQNGIFENIEQIKGDIEKRDANDEGRDFAPLKQSEDAIVIDTTDKTIQQVSREIFKHISNYIDKS